MANCVKCGVQLQPGVTFCPGCGTPVAPAQQQPGQNQYYGQQQQQPGQNQYYGQQQQRPVQTPGFMNTPDYTAQMHPQDIAQNKFMAVLAYFGPLVLIPWFAAPNSHYARFHAKQGIMVCILDVAYTIVSILLNLIKIRHTEYWFGVPVQVTSTPWFVTLIVWLIGLPIFALAILGVINAATGKAKELPFIGKIKIIK